MRLSGFIRGGGDRVISDDRATIVDIRMGHPGSRGFHRVVPAVGADQVAQGAVNCSWMIHVVRLCRLNLSAGAFSLHAD